MLPKIIYMLLVVLSACANSNGLASNADENAARLQFELIRGHGIRVCDAYLRGLQSVNFIEPPYCDRPQLPVALGFESLSREPLTARQLQELFPAVEGLLENNDPKHFFSIESQRKLPVDIASLVSTAQLMQDARIKRGVAPMYYRVKPDGDLDDDSRIDRLLVWRGNGMACGPDEEGRPRYVPTRIVVLDGKEQLDVLATRRLFTAYAFRPAPVAEYDDSRPALRTRKFPAFATAMGVVRIAGKTYIDAFETANNTLTLFDLGHAQLTAVCDVRWTPGIQ